MKYKLHHTIKRAEDSFILEGETIEEIKQKMNDWYKERGIDDINEPITALKHNYWSEKIED